MDQSLPITAIRSADSGTMNVPGSETQTLGLILNALTVLPQVARSRTSMRSAAIDKSVSVLPVKKTARSWLGKATTVSKAGSLPKLETVPSTAAALLRGDPVHTPLTQ